MGYFKISSWKDVLLFVPKLIHVLWAHLIVKLILYLGEISFYVTAFYFLFKACGVYDELCWTLGALFGIVSGLVFVGIFTEEELDNTKL